MRQIHDTCLSPHQLNNFVQKLDCRLLKIWPAVMEGKNLAPNLNHSQSAKLSKLLPYPSSIKRWRIFLPRLAETISLATVTTVHEAAVNKFAQVGNFPNDGCKLK